MRNNRIPTHPTPGAAPATLVDNLMTAWEAVVRLRNDGHTVASIHEVKPGQRPKLVLEASPRLAELAEKGTKATWFKFGTKAGQRFRCGILECAGAVVTWTEILGASETKRRAA